MQRPEGDYRLANPNDRQHGKSNKLFLFNQIFLCIKMISIYKYLVMKIFIYIYKNCTNFKLFNYSKNIKLCIDMESNCIKFNYACFH